MLRVVLEKSEEGEMEDILPPDWGVGRGWVVRGNPGKKIPRARFALLTTTPHPQPFSARERGGERYIHQNTRQVRNQNPRIAWEAPGSSARKAVAALRETSSARRSGTVRLN